MNSCKPMSKLMVCPLAGPDLDGLCSSSLPTVGYSSFHCGTIPINAVVWLMSIDHNIVLEVTLLVFADS